MGMLTGRRLRERLAGKQPATPQKAGGPAVISVEAHHQAMQQLQGAYEKRLSTGGPTARVDVSDATLDELDHKGGEFAKLAETIREQRQQRSAVPAPMLPVKLGESDALQNPALIEHIEKKRAEQAEQEKVEVLNALNQDPSLRRALDEVPTPAALGADIDPAASAYVPPYPAPTEKPLSVDVDIKPPPPPPEPSKNKRSR